MSPVVLKIAPAAYVTVESHLHALASVCSYQKLIDKPVAIFVSAEC
jgi:hypothetical protein